jgi:type II secretory pathway pseudopilin PulG
MANGTTRKKGSAVKAARGSVVSKKGTPWGTIVAVVAVVALAASVIIYYMVQSAPKREQEDREAAAASFAPSAQDPDPSKRIPGVVTATYTGSVHVLPTERVAYDKTPPFGGPHDGYWAACTGVVYPNAVRTENMVHALEHGAVWIAYNPQQVTGDALNLLSVRVKGKPFTMMSPYPGLDKPISLQSWGHQLKLDDANDARIDEFIAALRTNPNGVYPEVGASCDALGPGQFDPDNPPPFDPSKPGPDAKPMDYKGTAGAQQEQGGMNQPSGAPSTGAPAPSATPTK